MENSFKKKPPSFIRNLKGAIKGIFYSLKTERHLRFHFFATLVVICTGLYFNLNHIEWLFLIYAIGSVITAELFNTAIERTVDLAKPEYHPIAGAAKDVASGAVLVTAIQAVIIGIIIFWDYIF